MKVELLQIMANPKGNWPAGAVIEVTKDEAEGLLRGHFVKPRDAASEQLARVLAAEAAKNMPDTETATAPEAPETTTVRKGRPPKEPRAE